MRGMHDIGERSKGKTREGANDPVTEGDLASHRVMYFGLREAFPSLNIISEEREHKDETMFIPQLETKKIRDEINIVGGEIHADRLTIWIDPLGTKYFCRHRNIFYIKKNKKYFLCADATQEYTENLTKYVTVMIGIAVDGRCIGGFIHKPFSNQVSA